ncbi:phospholipid-translocating P-type ATPase, flippase family protein [Tritrichomonas foetus]|uniref:Phospholipid-transporting ATPase n=1 Tax=Tritrichomonas foetus TaxID=1144522 RepID=A0A1J4KCY1_9EUKA|nr:phospholipid-translocating P-type ATPase, flippase family protein [Tritrichomonas foetus]|eukprot:OHT07510.1 phospholipid-translocating P-type ATPase, flippase family protein [Tritrichomonas foetus]
MNEDQVGRTVILHQTHNHKGKLLFKDNRISTTKYNILTFIPKNLFFQFSRIANFYFLIIILLLQFSWAPISATVAVVPLAIVILFTMVRDGIEDIMRWRSDQKINSSTAHRLINGGFEDIKWMDVHVGDIIQIMKDEQIPADCVVFSTNHDDGIAYIDTCNLDGETNLKIRQAIPVTNNLKTGPDCAQFNAKIECDLPNNKLYVFNGNIEINSSQYSLDNRQVLLRGCVLRNTQWAIGAVVYTGHESKLMKNSSAARTKRSLLERGLNWKLISILIFLVSFAFIGAGVGYVFETKNINTGKHWYFGRNEENKRNLVEMFFILLVSHIVIINAIIPISLYVTLEIVRLFQAMFVRFDADMYDEENDMPAAARTSNISDDLGQIEYIFSDKTGTLTRNMMEFMKCSIGGKIYGCGTTEVAYAAAKRRGISIPPPDTKGKAFKDADFMKLIKSKDCPTDVRHFLWLLSVCHAVIPEEDEKEEYGIAFQASSPDEGALVLAAADFGYIFTGRSSSGITLKVNDEEVQVPVLANLEFTSERKRSSVIIKHPETNEIVLYCKGADDLIFQRLSEKSPNKEETRENLKEFAANGLRTLCCAYRVIDEDFFNRWIERYNDANCAITGRDEAVNAVANEVECDLTLIGATAIEDKLQIGVPDTIESLLRAGINIWVITGDKRETAINIGFACSLLSSDMKLIELDTEDIDELMTIVESAINEKSSQPMALVASGSSLHHLLDDEHADKFYQLSKRCQSVICCRVSPLQKATIVKIMREKTGSLALAVGDGANDVGMILQADIGVGISGREGRQAVLASDYAIGQFRFLKKLLLVHGYLNFYRNVDLVNYSFYKNMAFSFNQIVFGFITGNGGATMYESVLYTIYNVIFTSVPPVIFAAADRDVSIESMMSIPEIFNCSGQRKWLQSYGRFWLNLILGMYHGVCAFIVPYFAMQPFVYSNGHNFGLREFGTTVYFGVVIIVNLRIALMCYYWTWLHHLFIWASILIFPLCALIIDAFKLSDDYRGVVIPLLSSSLYWIPAIGSTFLAMLPLLLIHTIQSGMNTTKNYISYLETSKKVFGTDASSSDEDGSESLHTDSESES